MHGEKMKQLQDLVYLRNWGQGLSQEPDAFPMFTALYVLSNWKP